MHVSFYKSLIGASKVSADVKYIAIVLYKINLYKINRDLKIIWIVFYEDNTI